MNVVLPLLITAVTAATPVTVTTLDGKNLSGNLQTLTDQTLDIVTPEGTSPLPLDSVMLVEFPKNSSQSPAEDSATHVTLADGSQLVVDGFQSDGTDASLKSSTFGTAKISLRQVKDVLLGTLDDKVAASWQDIQQREARDDLLVFRKGDVLDYVAGSVGKITDETVTIRVRDRELSAPLDRIFGMVFAERSTRSQTALTRVDTITGDRIQAKSLKLTTTSLTVTGTSGIQFDIPLNQMRSLDFGGGRIRFLADLPFDDSQSAPPRKDFPVVWFVSRNSPAGSGGQSPLTIGKQEYRRGLWLHSGAVLRYRLNREFQKMRAIAGFDLTHQTRMPRFNPHVRLVILGDGKQLYSQEFGWQDTPQELDIDITDVRELQIRVDSLGSGVGILEHFALGDAQVIQ